MDKGTMPGPDVGRSSRLPGSPDAGPPVIPPLLEHLSLSARLGEALTAIDETIHSTLESDTVMQEVLSSGTKALGARYGVLLLRDDERFRVARVEGLPARLVGTEHEAGTFPNACEAMRRASAVEVPECAPDPFGLAHDFPVRALLVAPVIPSHGAGGCLGFGFEEPRTFLPAETHFASRLGSSLALALENARRYEAERAGRARSELLHAVAHLTASAEEGTGAARHVMERVVEALEADAATVWAPDAARTSLVPLVHAGFPESYFDSFCFVPFGSRYSASIAFERGSRVAVHEMRAAEGPRPTCGGVPGVTFELALPLVRHGETLGALTLAWRRKPSLQPDDLAFWDAVAREVAIALEHGRLLAGERRSVRLAEALNAVNELLLSTLSVDEMVERMVANASEAVGAPMCLLAEREGADWVVRQTRDLVSPRPGERFLQSTSSAGHALSAVAGALVREDKPQMIENALADPRADRLFAARNGLGSYVVFPLRAKGTISGFVLFGYPRPRRFDGRDVEFAERLSTAVSLALDNARRYQSQHRIADTLQEAMLIAPQEMPGLSMAHAYRSAFESARVGGDFYDAFELDQGWAGLLIGDVSGKGLDAAALTSLVKNSIRAKAVEKGTTPAQVLDHVNALLHQASGAERFATVFFGMLDRRDGRLVYCNAGHTTCALVRADGGLAHLPATSPVCGAFDHLQFEGSETYVDPEDLLFLYTDGLSEVRGPYGLFGEERVFDALATSGHGAPEDAVAAVISRALDWSEGPLTDDVAVLAVKRVPVTVRLPVQQKMRF